MKKLLFTYLAVFLLATLMFTSCESDSEPDPTPPTIAVSGNNTATVAASMKASFSISAVIGSEDLKTIKVLINGQSADLSSFSVNGTLASSNPVLLSSPDTKGFSYSMAFNAPFEEGTSLTYSIEVEDEAERKSSIDVIVSASVINGTTPPMISVSGDNTASTIAGTMASFDITSVLGNEDLKSIIITKAGIPVNVSDFFINGSSPTTNPVLLLAQDTKGFMYTMGFRAPSIVGTSYSYKVELEDEAARKNSIEVIVTALVASGPTISVIGDNSATVIGGTMAVFNINTDLGSFDLKLLKVSMNGQNTSLSDFSVNGSSPTTNPVLLLAQDTKGFSYTMGFRAPVVSGTSYTYSIEVEDEAERKSSIDVVVVSSIDVESVFEFNKSNIVGNTYDLTSSRSVSNVKFNAIKGSSPLDFIAVSVGGVILTSGEITYPGGNGSNVNPYVLVGAEKEAFTAFTIGFSTPSTGGETLNYVVTLTDEAGETTELYVNLSKLVALDGPFAGQLHHMAGSSGCTPGFNLLTGSDVSSSGSDADRDMLNSDQGAMAFTGNWESKNNTLFVKDNTGNLRLTSTKAGAIEIYGLSTPSATISNPGVGDIYVAKLRGTDIYAIIEIELNEANDNSCNMSTSNRGKLEFAYYRG